MHFLFLADDLHSPSSEHEAGAHEDRVADLSCSPYSLFHRSHGTSFGLRYLQCLQKLLEGVPVFRAFDRIAVGADEADAAFMERLSQVDRRLSPKRSDDSLRLLHCDDIHHVFDAEGFKIQFVRTGIIRGYGLGIVVDDNGFIARPLQGLDCVDRGVIEFHPLADADGPGSQDDDFLFP